jgi:hypothetical protein
VGEPGDLDKAQCSGKMSSCFLEPIPCSVEGHPASGVKILQAKPHSSLTTVWTVPASSVQLPGGSHPLTVPAAHTEASLSLLAWPLPQVSSGSLCTPTFSGRLPAVFLFLLLAILPVFCFKACDY